MRKISPGTVTVGVLAILFGLVAAYTVKRVMEAKPVENAGVDVVVAQYNLPRHTRILDGNIRVVKVPADQVPDGAITGAARAINRLVSSTLPAGEPITEKDLYPIDEEPLLSRQVPPGQRAVTISVQEEHALSGVLLPDSVIDISLTAASTEPDVPGNVTLTLVRGATVLATNQQRYRFSENSGRELRTITVAATPEDANKLILAQQYGTLSVTLRSEEEKFHFVNDHSDDLVSTRDLLRLGPPRNNGRRQFTSQIWRGTSVSEVRFEGDEIEEAEQATIASENAAPLAPLGRATFPATGRRNGG